VTPDLSRRIARAVNALPDGTLTLARRLDLAEQAQPHDRFEDLPEWIQDVVRQGETK
jgi:hypothetical protein